MRYGRTVNYQNFGPATQYSKEDEERFLKAQAEDLKRELENITQRLSELEKEE